MSRIDFEQIGYDAEGEPQFGIREVRVMSRVIHTTKKQPLLREICQLVGYTKRIVHVVPCESVQLLNTDWDRGTRTRYRAVNIQTMEMIALPQREGANVRLHSALAIVAATVKDGHEQPITVYLRPENVRQSWVDFNPADLTWEERVVLAAVKTYKGLHRIAEAHNICALGEDTYQAAKERLQDRGLLDQRGAITVVGINVIGATTLYDLALEQPPTHHRTGDK